MPRIGPHPSSAPGGGVLVADAARATSIGQFNQPTWVTKVRIGLGRAGTSNANVQAAIWQFQNGAPGPLLWSGASKVISTYMDTKFPGGTGQPYEWSVTGLLAPAGIELAGGAYNSGTATAGYWQDNSGARMWFRDVSATLPNPFSANRNSPEGRISISVEGITNRRPNKPSVVSPADGSSVTTQTPTVMFFATDPDAAYGDEIDAAKIEIWNSGNTAIIQDTGWVDPGNGGGINLYSVTLATLTQGQVVRARIYVRDLAGYVSDPELVTFTVVAAGTWSNLTVGSKAGTDNNDTDVVTSATPTLSATWQHPNGLDSKSFEVRIVNHTTGAVYRGPYTHVATTPVGFVVPFNFTVPTPDWTAMARGSTVYRYEIRGTDTNDATGPWIRSRPFKVNTTPTVATKSPVDLLTTATPPTFWASINDTTDDSPTMRNMAFEVEHIASASVLTIAAEWDNVAVLWIESKEAAEGIAKAAFFALRGYADYRWRVVGQDPWGAAISDSWRTFTYAQPPSITMTSPANGTTITTATPTLSFTSDRTLAQYQVTLYRDDFDSQVSDSGSQSVTTSSFDYDVPEGVLRNHVPYRAEVWVKAADGLENTATFTFDLVYDAPEEVHDVVAYTVASSLFDSPGNGIANQRPNVHLEWVPPVDPDISRQVVIRISPNNQNRFWWIDDLSTGVFEDATPAGKMEHEYYIGYTKKMNGGVDTVMSTLVLARVYVDIKYTTITSENPDDPSVTLHFWRDRQARRIHDKQLVNVMGLKAPIGFQGELSHIMIDGEFRALDHDLGSFSARDVVDTVTELAELRDLRPEETVINIIKQILGSDTYIGRTPRILYYRDPNQRSVPMMIMAGPDEIDEHEDGRATYRIQGVEVASDIQYDAYVNSDDIIDMTGTIEPTSIIDARTMTGRDRAGTRAAGGTVTSLTFATTADLTQISVRYSRDGTSPYGHAYLAGPGVFGTTGSVTYSGGTLTVNAPNGMQIVEVRTDNRILTSTERSRLAAIDPWTWDSLQYDEPS